MIDAVDFGRGFIHRLDTPSSGLILAATSLQGYCSVWAKLGSLHLFSQC
jgi:23S rRNA-/tRNA-specific pseudouridylate synthase